MKRKNETVKKLELCINEKNAGEIERYSDTLDTLAWMLENGKVFEKDAETAFRLYEILCKNGDARAYNNAGWMLLNGSLGDPDVDAACRYFARAFDRGDDLAAVNIGNMYEYGKLVEPDYNEALYWYRLAAERGNIKGRFNAANLFLTYDFGSIEDKRNAVREMEEIAECGGCRGVAYALGHAYQEGIGVETDYEKAMMYYIRGCLENDTWCFNQMGCMYGKGLGVDKDDSKALEFYIVAAELGDALAAVNVGYYYENGRGCEKDLEKALEYYRMAADAGEEYGIEGCERITKKMEED